MSYRPTQLPRERKSKLNMVVKPSGECIVTVEPKSPHTIGEALEREVRLSRSVRQFARRWFERAEDFTMGAEWVDSTLIALHQNDEGKVVQLDFRVELRRHYTPRIIRTTPIPELIAPGSRVEK
jgi:hypothetical protein